MYLVGVCSWNHISKYYFLSNFLFSLFFSITFKGFSWFFKKVTTNWKIKSVIFYFCKNILRQNIGGSPPWQIFGSYRQMFFATYFSCLSKNKFLFCTRFFSRFWYIFFQAIKYYKIFRWIFKLFINYNFNLIAWYYLCLIWNIWIKYVY